MLILVMVRSPRFATQTDPSPLAMGPGPEPAGTTPTSLPVSGSTSPTWFGLGSPAGDEPLVSTKASTAAMQTAASDTAARILDRRPRRGESGASDRNGGNSTGRPSASA